MKLKRFIVEAVLDRSFFERVNNRNVFRYRTESICRVFFARSLKGAKRLAAKHLALLLAKNGEHNVVTAYLHRETPIANRVLFPPPKRRY